MTQPISCQGYSTFFTFSIIEVHFIAALVKAVCELTQMVHLLFMASLFPKQELLLRRSQICVLYVFFSDKVRVYQLSGLLFVLTFSINKVHCIAALVKAALSAGVGIFE